jgi:hypothetical protein
MVMLRLWLEAFNVGRLWQLTFVVSMLLRPFCASAGDDSNVEYKVKATFLASFSQFVEWPNDALGSATTPIVVGVLGDDPFGNILEQAAIRKTSNGRAIQIIRFQDPVKAAAGSHILFIGNSEKSRLGKVLQELKDKPVLTVAEMPAFLREGGMVRFVIRDDRVQLEINPQAAQNNNLRISSKLLRLASIVEVKERH